MPTRPKVSTIARQEWIEDITFAANQQVSLTGNGGCIPNDRFLFGLLLEVELRITNAGSNAPSGQQADAQYALLDTITVSGTHKIRGMQETIVNVRGADLRQLTGMYRARYPYNANSLVNTASAANDIRYFIEVPFTPLGVNGREIIDYLLDAPNYDSLKLQINCGDDQSVFTYGTRGVPTLSAFGSGTGSGRIRVHGLFAQAGNNAFRGFVPARAFRYFKERVAPSELTASTTGARLFDIPRGNLIRNMFVKTGVKSSAVASGNSSYNTLSDTILSGNIKVMRGTNKSVRLYQDYYGMREHAAMVYGLAPATGYAAIDFAPHGSVNESLDLRSAISGATGDIDCYLQADTTGAANQSALVMFEELRYSPVYS